MHIPFHFLFSAVGLLVAAFFVPGVHGGPFLDLLVVAVLLGTLKGQFRILLTGMKGMKGIRTRLGMHPLYPLHPC